MPKVVHVNGTSLLSVGPQGKAGGLTELGLSVDGVDIDFELFTDDVIADSGGPQVPVDVQDLGKIANITARLTIYDSDVLESLLALGADAANLEPAAGTLLLKNNRMRRVVIASPIEAVPWRFFFCHLVSPLSLPKLGTIRTMPAIKFRAIPGTGTANTMAKLPLYDHVSQ